MKKYYIAYGSNLNVQQMKFRCPGAKVVGKGPSGSAKPEKYLEFEAEVTADDEKRLDAYEGYPNFYYKKNMKITLAETGKIINAFVYIMHEERKLGIPSYAYVRTCVQGYRDFGFDLKHLRLAFDISERGVRIENG